MTEIALNDISAWRGSTIVLDSIHGWNQACFGSVCL